MAKLSAPAPSILLVEDNEKNIELTVDLLLDAGYPVTVARNTDEARDRLRDRMPDLILLDIALPGEDGLALLDDIRFLPGGEAVPVIAFTAYNLTADMHQLIASGCDGFIGKPFKQAEFLATVARFLAGGRAAKSAK